MKKAGIDIGTNSSKMIIKDMDNKDKVLDHRRKKTPLGKSVGTTNIIAKKDMVETFEVIKNFVEIAQGMGVDKKKIKIISTAVLRVVENSDEFIQLVEEELGITIRILSGEEEGTLVWKGISCGEKESGILDIGGGSTEVVYKDSNKLKPTSIPIGAIKMKNLLEGKVEEEKIYNDFLDRLKEIPRGNIKKIYGVAGTICTNIMMGKKYEEFDFERLEGEIISLKELYINLENIRKKKREKDFNLIGLPLDRLEIIEEGTLLLIWTLNYLEVESLVYTNKGLLDGLLDENLSI